MTVKSSRLSTEQVIWCNCLLFALFACRFGIGDYIFANERLQDFAMAIFALLFVFLAVVVFMGPRSIVRTISLLVTVPIAMFSLLGSCALATHFTEHDDAVRHVGKAGDVTFELVQCYDVTYYDICKYWIELRMRRPVLNGILEERKQLIIVHPAWSATAEFEDGGKFIRFNSPALLGRKAIARTYSTDWDKAKKTGLEKIGLTPAEQHGTAVP